jgi:FdhD protein
VTERARPGPTSRRRVHQLDRDTVRVNADSVVTEEPLEIRLGWPGQPPVHVAVVMRTPGHDFELAAGFLLSEGVYALGSVPATIAYCVDKSLRQAQRYNVVTATLSEPPARLPSGRATAVSSACGVCGTQSLDAVFAPDEAPLAVSARIAPALVSRLPDVMRASQALFDRTGATHAAGIFSAAGELVVLREDIGRHNAVDKVLGARVLGVAAYGDDVMLCTSGRIGFDIVTKAVAGRIPVIVAVGGPSSLAVELAERAGVTLCGFVRGQRLVLYTEPDRLTMPENSRPAVGGGC